MKKNIIILTLIAIFTFLVILYPDFRGTSDRNYNSNVTVSMKVMKTALIYMYYENKKEPYPVDIHKIKSDFKKNNMWKEQINPYNINKKQVFISINYNPKDEDEYIYDNNQQIIESGNIAYYLNKKENTFYLYGIGKDNKIIRDSIRRTENLFFNRYKPFCVTNEGTEYSGFPKK